MGKPIIFTQKNDMISFINHEINQLDVHDLYYTNGVYYRLY